MDEQKAAIPEAIRRDLAEFVNLIELSCTIQAGQTAGRWAQHIATLEAENDALKSTNKSLNRRVGALEHAVSTQSERGTFERYFKCTARLWSEADAEVKVLKATIASLLSIDDSKIAEYVVLDPKALKAAAGNRVAELEAKVQRLSAPVSDGVVLIAAERQRQIDVKGWTPEHDDAHVTGAMVHASRAYCQAALVSERHPGESLSWPNMWPWDAQWWRPSPDPIRNLVKAGALIAAEIDRLERAARSTPPAPQEGEPR